MMMRKVFVKIISRHELHKQGEGDTMVDCNLGCKTSRIWCSQLPIYNSGRRAEQKGEAFGVACRVISMLAMIQCN